VVYDWAPDVPAPAGYALDGDLNSNLMGSGIGLLASAYLVSAMVAAASTAADRSGWAPLFIPVVGPFAAIATLDPSAGGTGLLIGDGTFQAVGVLAIALSFVDVRYKLIRTAGVELRPVVATDTQGMTAKVRF